MDLILYFAIDAFIEKIDVEIYPSSNATIATLSQFSYVFCVLICHGHPGSSLYCIIADNNFRNHISMFQLDPNKQDLSHP